MTSPILGIEYLQQNQEGGEVLVNEAINKIERFVQPRVKSRTTSAQPGSPAEGDRYLLPGSPTGAQWSGQGGKFAAYYGGWQFTSPHEGMSFWVDDADQMVVYNGSSWEVVGRQAAADADTTSAAGTPAAGTTDVGGAFNQTTLNNNFATLVAELNDLKSKLRASGLLAT